VKDFEIDPWAASDGLPEVADDDSYAVGVREVARDPNEPSALPPDREDGPMALDEYGTTSFERTAGEPLEARLSRELPEVDAGERRGGRIGDLRAEGDRARGDERDEQSDPILLADTVEGNAEDWFDERPIDPQVDSAISLYDRPVSGLSDRVDVGALTRPGEGYSSFETNEIANEVDGTLGSGGSLGGLGGEELAMHEMPDDEITVEEAQSTSEPYVDPRERSAWPVFRTGADQEWEPEDLAVAQGWDPTPHNIERARRKLEELGPSAIERIVP